MRINVYSQELTPEVLAVEKVSNTGIRYGAAQLILRSAPELHHPPLDDDRSAVTFWLPHSEHRREEIAQAFDRIAAIFRGDLVPQPASVPDCDHVWVEYVQPVYKNAMAGDVIRSGECGVKRYENLGFMCDKCGAVKPPAQPASVAEAVRTRLIQIQVGGCTCDTKTPEIECHDKRCHYRLSEEIMQLLAAAPQPPTQVVAP